MRRLPNVCAWMALVLGAGLLAGCASPRSAQSAGPTLRVGITPDYAPLIYKQGNAIAGLEADLARQLGAELGRPIQFVEVRWGNQLTELVAGNTDIVMSGMSITQVRELRTTFAEPYLRSGLMVLARAADAGAFTTAEDVLNTRESIGVKTGTTAAAFARENMPNARIVEVAGPEVAPYELRRRRIGLFLHDGHSIAWLASENEGDLTGVFIPLTEEYMAWAVRRTDTQLLADVNAALRRWKENGILKAAIHTWMPYADQVTFLGDSPPPADSP